MHPPVTEFEIRRAEVGERLAAFRIHADAAARKSRRWPEAGLELEARAPVAHAPDAAKDSRARAAILKLIPRARRTR